MRVALHKTKTFKIQKGHRRLTVFRLDALTGSLLTHPIE